MYEALAARIPKINRLEGSWVTSTLAQEKSRYKEMNFEEL
jgi:hypothetical protein